eukprot:SAG31_NODE_457_length_15415_cov_4.380387_24_plen_45_part_00
MALQRPRGAAPARARAAKPAGTTGRPAGTSSTAHLLTKFKFGYM